MTDAGKSGDEYAQWMVVANHLAQVKGTDYSKPFLPDQISRVIREEASASLIADAFGEAFRKDVTYVDFGDIAKAARQQAVLCWDDARRPFLVTGRTLRGRYRIAAPGPDGTMTEDTITSRQLRRRFADGVMFQDAVPLDVWSTDSTFKDASRWFWDSIRPLFSSMRYLVLAAIVGNILAVAASLFALQVWDRVIPAQSVNSLTVLVIGVGFAVLFELILRLQRAALIDDVGKTVDHRISAGVFSHMLNLKADSRPASLGAMAAQIREINQIREAISSSMLSAAIDLPFLLIYVAIIYLIGGALVFPILIVIPVIVIMGIIAQVPLARLAKQGLSEASLRNGLIVESILKSDEIKLQEAESTMLLRWERTVDVANTIGNKQRWWRNLLMNTTQSFQQLCYIAVVSFGAIGVINGDLTMGQVIACSILTNRAIAPLTQVSAVMGAIQGSIMAKRSIDELTSRPADTANPNHLRRDLDSPDYAIRALKYAYPGHDHTALIIPKLHIKYGERIGIVGRIGSGKSTFLRLLSGIVEPSDGTILLDGTEMKTVSPSDVRRAVGYQSQDSMLLRGTIRDNLAIARPSASDSEMIEACKVAGVLDLIKSNPQGLDLMINEAGQGLSGGQKQSLILARTILRQPKVVLMDEPTASMDDQTEAKFIASLSEWGAGKTIVIATHRLRPLSICDRLIVINEGRIVNDGPKDDVIAKLKSNGGS
ncbi:ATP-binding cassette domain-containing protein [Loktanella sp. 3ANDIMAR09]|uniref:ATP-binding cassette domain-containing protein n=1 Tax=Loktanella sp. 3ANDIMAR09 TaxID=1225657 RepID=UPI0006F429E2|nr:ATP-binding cassette domain-containing protein [Loktanella sp. 3ANDIMAR09]